MDKIAALKGGRVEGESKVQAPTRRIGVRSSAAQSNFLWEQRQGHLLRKRGCLPPPPPLPTLPSRLDLTRVFVVVFFVGHQHHH